MESPRRLKVNEAKDRESTKAHTLIWLREHESDSWNTTQERKHSKQARFLMKKIVFILIISNDGIYIVYNKENCSLLQKFLHCIKYEKKDFERF